MEGSAPGYTAKHLDYLPLTWALTDGQDVEVSYLRDEHFEESFHLIQDSARRGNNVGMDEYPDQQSFRSFLEESQSVIVKKCGENNISAIVAIRNEISARTEDCMICEIRFFLTQDLWVNSPGGLSSFIHLGEKLSVDLDLGYIACVVQVALPCLDWMRIVRSENYVNVAILPKSINLLGKGLVENCKFFKRLNVPMRMNRSMDMIKEHVSSLYADESEGIKQLDISFLPLYFKFSNGIEAILRNQHPRDDVMMYEIFQEACNSGNGFGTDEIPNISIFRDIFLVNKYVCIFQEVETNSVIGLISIGKAWHTRTSQNIVGEVTTMLYPEFRGKGLGKEIVSIGLSLCNELGYRYILNDSLMTNARVHSIISANNKIWIVGTLPFGAHVQWLGWVDMLFDFAFIEGVPTLKELGARPLSSKLSHISKL